jgi:hypothetical protein
MAKVLWSGRGSGLLSSVGLASPRDRHQFTDIHVFSRRGLFPSDYYWTLCLLPLGMHSHRLRAGISLNVLQTGPDVCSHAGYAHVNDLRAGVEDAAQGRHLYRRCPYGVRRDRHGIRRAEGAKTAQCCACWNADRPRHERSRQPAER